MNRLYLKAVLIIIFTLSIISCKKNTPVLYKNITGKANELLVVIADDTWNSKPGELIKAALGQYQAGLPQDEPIFDVTNIPPIAFKSIFKSSRNIIQVTVSSTVVNPGVVLKENLWAYPQAIVEIKAQSTEQFEELFNSNSTKIIAYIKNAEKNRFSDNYDKYYEKSIFNILNQNFGVTLKVPPGFVVASQKKDFAWFRYETPEISQGIIIYTFPYASDSTFTVNYLVSVRDSILKENIPGQIEGSYMTTEKEFDQLFQIFEHNKNYSSEMRGLWELEKGFMGGPYVAIDELDASNQRVVSVFGYVYAPSKDKRNLLHQVEAMIYSLKMNDQAKNDKINTEIKMSN